MGDKRKHTVVGLKVLVGFKKKNGPNIQKRRTSWIVTTKPRAVQLPM